MTKSQVLGKNTSLTEVSNISSHGVWIYTNGQEYFLSFEDFPWFKYAPVNKIINVEEPSSGHYYWPELDIDLSINMIKHPEKFPLLAK
ncbi:MAG: DUF2442 domain-containing protein [Candidatus Marinimicrobia bacterium]|nr:DUF2442 domain-containing protein [Candidatus Neomarinimicrobiota bacterium]